MRYVSRKAGTDTTRPAQAISHGRQTVATWFSTSCGWRQISLNRCWLQIHGGLRGTIDYLDKHYIVLLDPCTETKSSSKTHRDLQAKLNRN